MTESPLDVHSAAAPSHVIRTGGVFRVAPAGRRRSGDSTRAPTARRPAAHRHQAPRFPVLVTAGPPISFVLLNSIKSVRAEKRLPPPPTSTWAAPTIR
jgi:hypothetical protein